MTLNGIEWKDRFHKFDMTGCVDFRSGKIKTEIGILAWGVPNKHTRDGSRLKYMTRIGTKPWIA